MTTALPSHEQAPAWLPTADIPVQRSAPPVRVVADARRDVAARPVDTTRPDAAVPDVLRCRWPTAVALLAAGLAVGTAVAIGAAGAASGAETPAEAAPASATSTVANISVPGRVLTSFGDGTWQIGVDIEPGTYTTTGAVGPACYQALRTARTGGEVVDGFTGPGPATVVLTEEDGWFETSGCATWSRTG